MNLPESNIDDRHITREISEPPRGWLVTTLAQRRAVTATAEPRLFHIQIGKPRH
jgi:hypothetical protein